MDMARVADDVGDCGPRQYMRGHADSLWLHADDLTEEITYLISLPSKDNPNLQPNAEDEPELLCDEATGIAFKACPMNFVQADCKILRDLGLSLSQQCEVWDLLWERGKSEEVSRFLWQVLSGSLPLEEMAHRFVGMEPICEGCDERAVETIRHCLSDCPRADNVWRRISKLRRHLGIFDRLAWEELLAGSPEVAVHLHSLQKTPSAISPSEFQQQKLPTPASLYIWELTRSYTLWHIWCARCTYLAHQEEVPVDVIILRVWKDVLTAARSLREDIKEKLLMHRYQCAQRLELLFWFCYNYKDTLFSKQPDGSLHWFTNPPLWLLVDAFLLPAATV